MRPHDILRSKYQVAETIHTVFIRICAQPRISALLEKAPILKAEKVNKRPPPTPPHFLPTPTQTQISAQPLPLPPKKGLPRRRSFLQCFAETLLCYIFAFCYYHLLSCCKIYILHLLERVSRPAQDTIFYW